MFLWFMMYFFLLKEVYSTAKHAGCHAQLLQGVWKAPPSGHGGEPTGDRVAAHTKLTLCRPLNGLGSLTLTCVRCCPLQVASVSPLLSEHLKAAPSFISVSDVSHPPSSLPAEFRHPVPHVCLALDVPQTSHV